MSTAPLHTPDTPATLSIPTVPGTTSGISARPGIVSLAIKDETGSHATYMPFLKDGGIFVPAQRPYWIGEEISLVPLLLDHLQKYQVAGGATWITPVGTPARAPGIGVYLGEDEWCRVLRRVIKEMLGRQIDPQRPIRAL